LFSATNRLSEIYDPGPGRLQAPRLAELRCVLGHRCGHHDVALDGQTDEFPVILGIRGAALVAVNWMTNGDSDLQAIYAQVGMAIHGAQAQREAVA
jgi:hypothetical protein